MLERGGWTVQRLIKNSAHFQVRVWEGKVNWHVEFPEEAEMGGLW